MKNYIFLFFAIFCLKSNAQDKVKLPLKDGQIEFEQIITVDSSLSQQTLYNAAKTWFVNTFKSVKAVIQSEDQINGRILGRAISVVPGVTIFNNPITPEIHYYIQIDVKKGKYRYRFYGFNNITDALGTEKEWAVEVGYNEYLNNKNHKGAFISRDDYNKKADKAFTQFALTFANLGLSLEAAMKNSKTDEF